MVNNYLDTAESGMLSCHLGQYHAIVEQAIKKTVKDQVLTRIWQYDHTLWHPAATEIENRLGWLNTISSMQANLPDLNRMIENIQQAGYNHALLCGMGGSSLAPELFSRTFATKDGFLKLSILDSTHPEAILQQQKWLDNQLPGTLFIISTKSGTTVETISLFKYFYHHLSQFIGKDQVGEHFIAITDAGSKLAELAQSYHFRNTLLNDPNIGGRYSALSFFGLVPAAIMGVDLQLLLLRAQTMAHQLQPDAHSPADDNVALQLGATMGVLAKVGRDKLTVFTSPAIAGFADWLEQLIAESSGKNGKGILPVVNSPLLNPDEYGNDHLFVHLKIKDDANLDNHVHLLQELGHPVIHICIDDEYDLGGQFFLWEMSTAVACHMLKINPFDQPDVESAKNLARQMAGNFQKEGKFSEPIPGVRCRDITLFSSLKAKNIHELFSKLLLNLNASGYLSIQAYIPPNAETFEALQWLRSTLWHHTHLATTVGYGPRFLHSTGQLHKGDAGKGLFVQITGDTPIDLAIPDQIGMEESSISFGALIHAQALGDYQALLNAGRQVVRFHLHGDILTGLNDIIQACQDL